MKTLTMKPLNWLKVSRQARRHFDEEELRQLGESLKVKQLQPIVARPDGTIIAGERRYRAAMLVGLKELMVILSEEPLTETPDSRLPTHGEHSSGRSPRRREVPGLRGIGASQSPLDESGSEQPLAPE